MPLNIMIIDQSFIIRKQLREMLCDYSDFCVIFDTDNIADSLAYHLLKIVDVALVDVRTCEGALEHVITTLKEMHHAIHVIILTDQSDLVYNTFALSLGADLLIDKANEFTRLPAAIMSCGESDPRFSVLVDGTAVHHGPQ